MREIEIETRDIHKVYPNRVRANQGVNFAVVRGEIHALVGENGAGKSTLMKILYGLEQPTQGQILRRGTPVQIPNPQAAIRLGIGMVHQNFMLVPSFTVAENVVLNVEPRRGVQIDLQSAILRTQALASQYGLQIAPSARIDSVPVGMRQRVEILKCLYRGAEVFILDEPTAVLTPGETRDLFAAIRNLVAQGKTVIFITHKLDEVKAISDRVTVMRDGAVIGTLATVDADERTLARMMVGREVLLAPSRHSAQRGRPVLTVRELTSPGRTGKIALDNVSLEVCEGEIVGIAGVEGNGQTELAETLTGFRQVIRGRITVDGRNLNGKTPRQVREAGVAYIPEDRLANGVALDASIRDNLIVDRYYRSPFKRRGLLNLREMAAFARAQISRYGIVTKDENTPARSLSGGNLQKVIVARELSTSPRLLIAAQPTRGVDVGAIEFIHSELIAQRAGGLAILLISADLGEVLSLSDRLLVMFRGQIVAQFDNPSMLSEDEIGLYMAGVKRQ